MHHVAIMKKSWGLIEKIQSGEKNAESRWYKTKRAPWNKIQKGDTIYFKDSGEPVKLKVKVTEVIQFGNLTPERTLEILNRYGSQDLGTGNIIEEVKNYVRGKKYCIIIFFDNVQKVIPFNIDKKGYGAMSAWICVKDISEIKTF